MPSTPAQVNEHCTGARAAANVTRRVLMSGFGAAVALSAFSMHARAGARDIRMVSLNWALSETLYAMNLRPIAAAELIGYDRMVGYPPTPSGIVDLGFQSDPNLELVSELAPDIIFIQSWQAGLRSALERLARVEAFTIYARGGDPFERACEAATRIAALAGQPSNGAGLLGDITKSLEACRTRLSAYDRRPIYLVQALSPENLVVFTAGSLFDGVMRRLGLRNAWAEAPDLLWGSSRIGVDALAANSEARIVWIASPDGGASQGLFESALWRSLPQAKSGCIGHLPLIWGFGGVPTAERFGRLITDALVGARGT